MARLTGITEVLFTFIAGADLATHGGHGPAGGSGWRRGRGV